MDALAIINQTVGRLENLQNWLLFKENNLDLDTDKLGHVLSLLNEIKEEWS